ncbi:MAG: hypothetical protein WAV28_12285 [Sedimentisphaerales bacterium]
MLDTRYSMLPPSLSFLRQGYEGTSYGGQAILDVVAPSASSEQAWRQRLNDPQ